MVAVLVNLLAPSLLTVPAMEVSGPTHWTVGGPVATLGTVMEQVREKEEPERTGEGSAISTVGGLNTAGTAQDKEDFKNETGNIFKKIPTQNLVASTATTSYWLN